MLLLLLHRIYPACPPSNVVDFYAMTATKPATAAPRRPTPPAVAMAAPAWDVADEAALVALAAAELA